MLKIIHHWWLAVLSAIVWWGMLIALLAVWGAQGYPVYPWITDRRKTILYISDIAATNVQAVFISCSAVQGLLFVLALASERLLRHNGRLMPNHRRREKWSSICAIVCAFVGQLGILFVSIFNTRYFSDTHSDFLIVFIVFVGVSSLFSIYEYFYLDRHYKDYLAITFSLWYKVAWFIIELAMAVGFAGTRSRHVNASAGLEWAVAFFYPFYTLIIAYDLWPAHKTEKGEKLNPSYPDPFNQSLPDPNNVQPENLEEPNPSDPKYV